MRHVGVFVFELLLIETCVLFVADMEGYNKAVKLIHQHPDHYITAD